MPIPLIGWAVAAAGVAVVGAIAKSAQNSSSSSYSSDSYDAQPKESKLPIQSLYMSNIDEISRSYPSFKLLADRLSIENSNNFRYINGNEVHCTNVIFIGKTGYGKSTTLNKICGKEIFPTSEIESCTKSLFSSDYELGTASRHYLSLCDLPGIGESRQADTKYLEWYFEMLKESSCAVYLLRADQRDFSLDEQVINEMFKKDERLMNKLIVGLNFSDKIEPIPRNYSIAPTEQQMQNLQRKIDETKNVLGIPADRIVFYSAETGYNLKLLVEKITSKKGLLSMPEF